MLLAEKDSRIQSLENFVNTALHTPKFYAQNYRNQGDTMSERFNNNNQGANIANFANQLKDNASQQPNQYIGQEQSTETIKTGAKTILILAANPKGTSTLRLDEEVRQIDLGLQRAKKRELFNLEQRSRCTCPRCIPSITRLQTTNSPFLRTRRRGRWFSTRRRNWKLTAS